jgi:hypothetical protein
VQYLIRLGKKRVLKRIGIVLKEFTLESTYLGLRLELLKHERKQSQLLILMTGLPGMHVTHDVLPIHISPS